MANPVQPELTIQVNVAAQKIAGQSTEFVTLKIKDAICDRFREERGIRPSVDTRTPDVRIPEVFLDERICTLYLDLSRVNPVQTRPAAKHQ